MVDMVGGVGTGYIICALYAIYEDIDIVLRYAEEMFRVQHLAHIRALIIRHLYLSFYTMNYFQGIREASKTAFDLTIPYISPVQGRALLSLVMKFFARTRMEDTWYINCSLDLLSVKCIISLTTIL